MIDRNRIKQQAQSLLLFPKKVKVQEGAIKKGVIAFCENYISIKFQINII